MDTFPHCRKAGFIGLLMNGVLNEHSQRKGIMKTLISALAAVAIFSVCGCSTTQVAQMEGRGTKAVYNAPFETTWRAAVDAAQQGDLTILNADPSTGYISAKRGVHLESFGENVGLWVSRLGPTETSVEVVSRQAGPPVLWVKNWEKRVQQSIAANLTREAMGATATGTGTIYGGPNTVYGGTTVPAYPPPAPATIAPSGGTASLQTQITTLQQQQFAREQELQREQNAQRRAAIQDDISSLKSDLRKLQKRLNELEQEQRSIPNP